MHTKGQYYGEETKDTILTLIENEQLGPTFRYLHTTASLFIC